jgi:hypothetical protein
VNSLPGSRYLRKRQGLAEVEAVKIPQFSRSFLSTFSRITIAGLRMLFLLPLITREVRGWLASERYGMYSDTTHWVQMARFSWDGRKDLSEVNSGAGGGCRDTRSRAALNR